MVSWDGLGSVFTEIPCRLVIGEPASTTRQTLVHHAATNRIVRVAFHIFTNVTSISPGDNVYLEHITFHLSSKELF